MDFDELVDRSQYPTMKWDRAFLAEHYGNADALPMGIADMDLKAPPAVIEQLRKRASHGVFGYEIRPESYFSALESWYRTRYGWTIEREHIELCPSILNGISVLIDQHSEAGDGVILQPPVFFEFRTAIRNNGRRMIKNPLKLVDGRYQMDFDDLETKAAEPRNKILILCNPHNPIGRVWTRDELERVACICTRHEVFVIADEIHGDFAFPPHRYVPYLTVSEGAGWNAATCISPGKTFNIAGTVDAMAVIPSEAHRHAFHEFAHRYQTNRTNVFAIAAIEAAYTNGAEWLDELIVYLQGNTDLIRDFLQANDLMVSLIEPDGTFLLWLDFRELGLDAKALHKFLAQEAGVSLTPGQWFGREGAGFARMTIGCPRSTIERALDGLVRAIAE